MFTILTGSHYQPLTAEQLEKKLHLPDEEQPELLAILEELHHRELISIDGAGLIQSALPTGTLTGILQCNKNGTGYVTPHTAETSRTSADIFIAAEKMRDGHDRDDVLVSVHKGRNRGGQRSGKILSVLKRASENFVGTYFTRDTLGYVRIDGKSFQDPVAIGDASSHNLTPGDRVVVEMLQYPSPHRSGEAVVTKVLGSKGDPGVETASIIEEFCLPQEFPEDVLQAAREQSQAYHRGLPTSKEELKSAFASGIFQERTDLTKEATITIDPATARDFDDAISLKQNSKGDWILGVHIADVAHFVPQGSKIDREALNRGTSVYLPGKVIPMIPEIISNGLASLQKGKYRLTKTVLLTYTEEGILVDVKFLNSVIKVNQRFAYEEVMPIIEHPKEYKGKVSGKIRQLLHNMHSLAMILRSRRKKAGALEMHLPEIRIDFDDQGRVSGAHESIHDESHEIIEEFMLAANIAVANELTDRGLPFLRRIHPEPNAQRLKALSEYVETVGFKLKKTPGRKDLQKLVNQVRHQPAERAVNYALLRSMKQAVYSDNILGHYALAEENYCHFTSPIRRYPDLLVHRIFDAIVNKQQPKLFSPQHLSRLAHHCTDLEKRAESAERELVTLKLLSYMSERVGSEMSVIITGVESFGFFVRGMEIPAEGLISRHSLQEKGYYDYDVGSMSLIDRRSGRTFSLGDILTAKVVKVDLSRRELDFEVVWNATYIHYSGKTSGSVSSTKSKSKGRSKKGEKSKNKRRRSRSKSRNKRKQQGDKKSKPQ